MKLGIIGGSGLEKLEILQDACELEVETPYGKAFLTSGKIFNQEIFLISRHGKKHEITPSHVNNRANISALKQQQVTHILATTAVGSLKEEIKPGDFVILDQFIDFTKHRAITFHEDFKQGPQHASLADPFSQFLREKLIDACSELLVDFHPIGTVISVEGPRFSTRAESYMFMRFADVINMSTAPEAILARELGIEYSVIAMSTDYDCWKQEENPVTWQEVRKVLSENAEKVTKLLVKVIENLASQQVSEKDKEIVKSKIRTIPDFPKPGIQFRDITTLLGDKEGFQKVIEILENRYKTRKIDIIAGIESRGFLVAGALASRLNLPVALIRKPGKLPSQTIKEEYELEYGKDALEMHKDSIKPMQQVLIIDDLLATGGTMLAACNLIDRLGGSVEECAFIINLSDLKGKEKLEKEGRNVFSIVEFEGE
jgi:5'-methylthioadenosine phosphorylase